MLKICVCMGFGVRAGPWFPAGLRRDQARGGRALALPCPQGPVAFQAPEAVFFFFAGGEKALPRGAGLQGKSGELLCARAAFRANYTCCRVSPRVRWARGERGIG